MKITKLPIKASAILIINFHSSLNAGDFALLECAIRILRNAFNNPKIIIASNWPDEPALKTLGVDIIPSPWYAAGVGSGKKPRWQVLSFLQGLFWAWWIKFFSGNRGLLQIFPPNWKSALLIYTQVDLVAAVPGNQFFSSGRFGWPLPTIAFATWLAHLYKKPLYILPQSIGPFIRRWDRWLLVQSYKHARRIYLRDKVSMHLAREIGLPPSKVKYIPDPAFNYPPADSEHGLEVLLRYDYQEGTPALGLTILASMPSYLNQVTMDRYYKTLANVLLRMVAEKRAQIFIFRQVSGPIHQEDDGIGALRVLDLLGDRPPSIHFVDENLPPQVLKACYGKMDGFIASRLHSGIFSMSMYVPTLYIGYLTKTQGVLEAAGLDENLIELNQLSEYLLWERLQDLWSHRQAYSEKLRTTIPHLISAIQNIDGEIAKDYEQFA